ncbi:MAG: hypothetical protein HVK41_05315 [Pelagibacteraceae bacterium]|jgi:hypothetical protein|nr:hypothetical protein [Pelagibacteraceae bacterium]MBO6470418.1 hypothetical protein [Pelagibacteraceae bacterium]MBO6470866.1 hypothetical protein [Pelagibacteraceae bacterium]MBO6479184.1 hypothetical protein [Pelagibacteraceae bacterium]HJO13833.1 hypothetical protein [Alphaproteobacteria bacterium]|tara:strand:- start:638 stop:1690 length:1053 start_codon:yes stop_codon:yes gene_type:complete
MNNITNIIVVVLILSVSSTSISKNIYATDFHHVDIKTNDATKTKLEEIKKIKIKSFISILNKILAFEDLNYLIKKDQYQKYLDDFVQNIIIENELITNDKYIADIKINFYKKDLIHFVRNNKLNYTDIFSEPILILSSYNEEFITYGLSEKNIFYDIDKLDLKFNNNLLNIKMPDLNPNDRFIISYKDIINNEIASLSKIAKKYNVNDILIINIKKIQNDELQIKIDYYSSQSDKFLLVGVLNLFNVNELHNYIVSYLSNWWKKNHLIDNSIINLVICTINSDNYSDLINIKDKINNLSQFKSMKTMMISYNNNIEKIEFYGDYSIFTESLILNKIEIRTNDKCMIRSMK